MTRIAVIERPKCKIGAGCNFICDKVCPVNRTGGDCVVLDENDKKPLIDEVLCIGCGICVKRCPTQCINVINLSEKLKEDPIHRFGANKFELFRLPIPKEGKVVGILGRNGIGKSTALNILAGTIRPNLGKFTEEVKEEDVIARYSNVSLGDYFRKLYSGKIKISYKPQRIELIPKTYSGTVVELIKKVDEKGIGDKLIEELGVENLRNRDIDKLSGGELQKVAIIATAVKKAEVYYFDEPASFCDITSRIKVARLIRSLAEEGVAVIVVEHDLATLDYISDEIQIVYGEAGAYGIISQSKGVRTGINEYMDGFLPDENMRFRSYPIVFSGASAERKVERENLLTFPSMEKKFAKFQLHVTPGQVQKGEVLAVMGANGLGKTTFLNMLAGVIEPDGEKIEKSKISYKVQYPSSDVEGTVRKWLMKVAGGKFASGWYKQNIMEKLGLGKLMDNEIKSLSGGELQKFYVAITLSKDCDIYAFDEPSAFIDVEDRLKVAEVIRDFVKKDDVCAIIVDHDVQFIDYIGDSMLMFEGEPAIKGEVVGPVSKKEGMNAVLKMLDITYRQDMETKRPRINKPNSQLDNQQRAKNQYYYS